MDPDLNQHVDGYEPPTVKLTNNPHTVHHAEPRPTLPPPIDHEARPAQRPKSSPVDSIIATVGNDLEAVEWPKLARAIVAARKRDATGNTRPDGFPAGTLGDGGPRATTTDTPTERAALTDELADEHHELTTQLVNDLLAIEAAQQRIIRNLKRIDEIADKPAQRYTIPTCAEKHCEDPAARPSRRGRCDACRMWLEREAKRRGCDVVELGPVPAEVIDARTTRRVHMSGPAASMI